MRAFAFAATLILGVLPVYGYDFPKLVVNYLERIPHFTDLDTVRVSPIYPIDLSEVTYSEVVTDSSTPVQKSEWEESYIAAEEEVMKSDCCVDSDHCCLAGTDDELTGLAAGGSGGSGGGGGGAIFGFSSGGGGSSGGGDGGKDSSDSGSSDGGSSSSTSTGGDSTDGVPVPEPSTYLLFGLLLTCVAIYKLRYEHERSR